MVHIHKKLIDFQVKELINRRTFHHQFSLMPNAEEKWYLITYLDDFSRFIFNTVLAVKETSWVHVVVLEVLN